MALILCFRCRAEFTSRFLAALYSALRTFQSWTFLCKPSWIKRPQESIRRNRPESFNSTIFARHTRRWNPTKPMAKWSFASEVARGGRNLLTGACLDWVRGHGPRGAHRLGFSGPEKRFITRGAADPTGASRNIYPLGLSARH